MNKMNTWIVGIAICLMANLASATDYATPAGVTLMSEADIKSKVVGNTLEGITKKGEHWAEWYGDTGKVVGRWKKKWIYYGKWQTEGPVFCVKYPDEPSDNWCNTMSLEGDAIVFYDKKGKVEGNGADLRPGKPDWL